MCRFVTEFKLDLEGIETRSLEKLNVKNRCNLQ